MKQLIILPLIFLLAMCSCHVSHDTDLTKAQADTCQSLGSLTKPNTITIIEYFGPWCGRCSAMKEVFSDFRNVYHEVKIITIDNTADFNQKFNVFEFQAYPFIVIFDGDSVVYKKEGTMTISQLSNEIGRINENRIMKQIKERPDYGKQ